MCGFGGSLAVWRKRRMRVQSINRFRDHGAMSPKNAVRSAGPWASGTATSSDPYKWSGGTVFPIEYPLPIAPRPQPPRPPQGTELPRLVLPLRGQINHTFLSIKPAMTVMILMLVSPGDHRRYSNLTSAPPTPSISMATSSPGFAHRVSTTLPSITISPSTRCFPRAASEFASQASASNG